MREDNIILALAIILTFILSMVLGMFLGSVGSFMAFLMGSGLVGYLLTDDIGWAAFYGAITCLLTGLLAFFSMVLLGFIFHWSSGLSVMDFGWSGIIIGLLINSITGAVGGLLGSLIR